MSGVNNNQPATMSPEEALQALILDPDLERLEDLLAEFNLFDVLGIARREPQHSALLAWLLDPRGSHGLRDYFLRLFLSEAAKEAQDREIGKFTPLDVDRWELTDIEVATERHNIDILLIGKTDELVCLIENKIGAGEQPGQLSRYLRRVEEEYEGLKPFPIFLTPDGMEPEREADAERWVPIDYGKVADLIERTLETRASTISDRVHGFLDQYKGALGRHVLDTKDNIDELALQIYSRHRAAIDLIIKAKPDLESNWDVIETAIKEHAPPLRPDSQSKWYYQFYAPELDEIAELKEGKGWTESGRMLLFQVNYAPKTLALLIGPGHAETRRRLYDLVQANGVAGVQMRLSKNLSPKWHTVYSKKILGKGVSLERDPDQAKPHIEWSITKFYDNDYWPIVNAIRKEFELCCVTPPAS